LTAIQAHSRRRHRPKSSTLGVAAVVCLVLLVLLAVAQVVHSHSVESNADHCPLCIAMHSVVPLAIMVVVVVLVRFGTAAPVLREIPAIIRYWHPTLFTRPPPVGC
jgi:hypothetical protein